MLPLFRMRKPILKQIDHTSLNNINLGDQNKYLLLSGEASFRIYT